MGSPPPVDEGWTLTVYDLEGRLVKNAINRTQSSDTSNLIRNADNSVDFYLQAAPPDPARAANWLPTTSPGQGFEVMWRLLAPAPADISGVLNGTGWQPPAITAAL